MSSHSAPASSSSGSLLGISTTASQDSASLSSSSALITQNSSATTLIDFPATVYSTYTYTLEGQAGTATLAVTLGVQLAPSSSGALSAPFKFPIIPVVAGGGGAVIALLLFVIYILLRRRRKRPREPARVARLDLAPEMELGPVNSEDREQPTGGRGTRSFSRLTFTAPYVIPPASITLSTAAPSTVSIGQQYAVAPRLVR
ncbi:hypothetical protein MKEN_01256700 [Mycena kentingensis (nom. inval.)]|nr:hypothetical protein MKEN_01256700 [Mycena kentingensis (nom. inval.)]